MVNAVTGIIDLKGVLEGDRWRSVEGDMLQVSGFSGFSREPSEFFSYASCVRLDSATFVSPFSHSGVGVIIKFAMVLPREIRSAGFIGPGQLLRFLATIQATIKISVTFKILAI